MSVILQPPSRKILAPSATVRRAGDRWARDAGVTELISHFDQIEQRWIDGGKKINIWDMLRQRELDVVTSEFIKCRNDFSYAARNYFWIINKRTKQDQLFKLWESQEYLLDTINRMKAAGRSQRIICVKARQLGASTVVEGLIAWRSMFFTNTDCFIVSYDEDHAAYLFGIMQHIYSRLPWWMKPKITSLEFKKGLIFDNPDIEDRRLNPGLNSKITVKGATAVTGVGQGRRLSGVHISEFADFEEDKAREIIEEDIENALDDGPETFGILETTPKGAGTYAHELWQRMVRMGDRATWMPLFLPWYFDAGHRFYSMPANWKPRQETLDARERAKNNWIRCIGKDCHQFWPRHEKGVDRTGTACKLCGSKNEELVLDDFQLAWIENRCDNVAGDEESKNKLQQEQADTAEAAFIVSGIKLFSDTAVSFAQTCIREPLARGFIDKTLTFHGVNPATGKCWKAGCEIDHSYDDDSLFVWELPQKGEEYVSGGDVGQGLGGKNDYSVNQMLKKNKHGGPDEQVACYTSNQIDPADFALVVTRMGHFYNTALVATEVNDSGGGTCDHVLRMVLQYPNFYRNPRGTWMNWKTTPGTKPQMYFSFRKGLDSRLLCVRDRFTVSEIHNFRREDNFSRKMGAMVGHDDRIMAIMIAYTIAHDQDWDEEGGIMRTKEPLSLEAAPFHFDCKGCKMIWPAKTPNDYDKCPKCNSMVIVATRNSTPIVGQVFDPDQEYSAPIQPEEFDPEYGDPESDLPSYHEL